MLFDDLSVAENIFLGHAPRTPLRPHRLGAACAADAREAAAAHRRSISIRRCALQRPRHRQQASGGDRPRACRSMRAIVIMDEPTAALSHKEIEELLRADRAAQARRQGDPVHQPQVRRDLPHRRPLHRLPRRRDGRRGADRRHHARTSSCSMMVGRAVDQIFPKREAAIGAPVLTVSGYRHPTEFDDISFELHKGEILGFYGLVGAGRSRGHAGALRHHPAVRGRDASGRRRSLASRSPADAIEAGIVYVPEERGQQGVVIGLPIFQNVIAALADAHLAVRLPAAGRGIRAGPRIHRAARPARLLAQTRMSARSRAATSRRWSSPSGWPPSPRSSSSTNRPRASTSAPRPPCTPSWANWSAQGLSRHHGVVGTARNPRHVRPRRRHARGADRGESTTTRDSTAETLVRAAAGIGDRRMNSASQDTAKLCWSLAIAGAGRADRTALPGLRPAGQSRPASSTTPRS